MPPDAPPMISVHNLTKRYAGVPAVDGISFDVAKGRVVGFLGPNGAGKTTTLRVLAGYHPPTSGSASVAGLDVVARSLDVRRRVGYLPENVPLYPEMRVSEYLDFRARLKGVPPGSRTRRIDSAIDRCGLAEVRRRVVGQLSKGYRQRVGLAEAMVHDPPLLILDEPTIGLDPRQIRQIRELIRDLGREHTVLLSTHILSEVEMVCDEVIIINRGRIAAVEQTCNLARVFSTTSRVVLEVRAPAEEARGAAAGVGGVAVVRAECAPDDPAWTVLRVEAAGDRDVREDLHRLAVAKGWPVRELAREKRSLEDIFVQVTAGENEAGAQRPD